MKRREPLIQGCTDFAKHKEWLYNLQVHIDTVEFALRLERTPEQEIDSELFWAKALRDRLEEDIAVYIDFFGR